MTRGTGNVFCYSKPHSWSKASLEQPIFGQIIRSNPLNAELNRICHLLALLGAHHILHVSRVRVKEHFNHLNAELNRICHLLALLGAHHILHVSRVRVKEHFNPLNAELNRICHLLALLGAHHILHVSRVRVKRFATSSEVQRHIAVFKSVPLGHLSSGTWIQSTVHKRFRLRYSYVLVSGTHSHSFSRFWFDVPLFFLINLLHIIYTRCTKISYKIVPATNFTS